MVRKRFVRLAGLVRIGTHRGLTRAVGAQNVRVLLSVVAVAVSITLLLVVTGLALGLGAETTTYGSGVDYWIVPEGGAGSALVSTGGPMLGETHATTATLEERDDVDYATPVLTHPVELESSTEREFVLAVGVVSAEGAPRVAGLDTTALTPGDPHHETGDRTGEIVASEAAASILDVDRGDEVTFKSTNETGTVVAVDERDDISADVPIVLVQLSELQTITGADDGDQADQILVDGTGSDLRSDLETVYSGTSVETRSGLLARDTADTDLSLALALGGLVIAIGVGTLFVATVLGMEVVANRNELAAMAAIGLAPSSRLTIIGIETVMTTLIGGALGVLGGTLGITTLNATAGQVLGTGTVAIFHPAMLGYGLVVAVVIGLLTIPYLYVLVRRLDTDGGVMR